jgi:AraC-like DNA-binding protein
VTKTKIKGAFSGRALSADHLVLSPPDFSLVESLPFILLQNILTYYLTMPCFLIFRENWKLWHTVIMRASKKQTPIDFENSLQWRQRTRYNLSMLAKVRQSNRAHWEPLRGVHGIFVPVLKGGVCVGVLQSGIFLTKVPSEDEVIALWEELTERPYLPHDPMFADYVQALVATPVLDETLIDALRELLELYGAFLAHTLDAKTAVTRMRELQINAFSRRLWHQNWAGWQALRPRFFRGDVGAKTLMQWEKEELGLTRFPTLALAAKRSGSGREWADSLGTLEFQREAHRFARELGESIAYPLGNSGIILLTSNRPEAPASEAEAELQGKIGRFTREMSQRFHCRIWVGQGGDSSLVGSLHQSYLEAVAALHVAVTRDQQILRYRELPATSVGETGLRHKLRDFSVAVFDQPKSQINALSNLYVQDLLLATRGRPETTRRLLIETLHRLWATLETRADVETASLEEVESRHTAQIETALDTYEMITRFNTALDQVKEFLEAPSSGNRFLALSRAREAICASLNEAWTLPLAAKRFGFSKSSFSKEFSRHVGLPFSEFLLEQRIEKAKRLLTGELSLKQVASVCGFGSTIYFQQIFKRKVGIPPGKYRQALLN